MDSTYNIPYPELYYRIYPKVINTISKNVKEVPIEENISQEEIDAMINEVCEEMIKECPEIAQDPMERRNRSSRYRNSQRIYYGRGRFLRDIVSIILISELLRRRYPWKYRYGAGYNYGPGNGYGLWY